MVLDIFCSDFFNKPGESLHTKNFFNWDFFSPEAPEINFQAKMAL